MKTFVVSWLFVAVLVGFTGALRNTALPMPALSAVLTVGFLGVLAVRRELRERALRLGIRTLIAITLTRFFGLYILWLARQGLLARDYAVLAGWGPIIVALGALVLLLVFRPGEAVGRQAILFWNVIGALDIFIVFAVMARMGRPDPLIQGGLASLPLSLLPTFLVPLLIVTHALIFVWWHRARPAHFRS